MSVLGIGTACIDLLLPVEEDFLQRHVSGEKGGAESLSLDALHQLIELSGATPQVTLGGSCANTIKGLAHLGEKCAFFSLIGQDELGEIFAHYLKQLNIQGLLSASLPFTTRVLCLITPDGQRTMRFSLKNPHAEEWKCLLLPHHFQSVSLVHLEAYLLRYGDLVHHIVECAKKAQVKLSMDLSSFEIVHRYRDALCELLTQSVDIVFANAAETKALTGLDPKEGCFRLQGMGPLAIVLNGNQGCLVGYQGHVFHEAAFPAHLVDSTGAGDLFASGFLYGYLRDYPLEKCAQLGNRLGAAVVEVKGAELLEKTWQEILKSL